MSETKHWLVVPNQVRRLVSKHFLLIVCLMNDVEYMQTSLIRNARRQSQHIILAEVIEYWSTVYTVHRLFNF